MFGIFKRKDDAVSPLFVLDPHTTSPGLGEPAIQRNDVRSVRTDSDIYDRARQIYFRARINDMRRPAGII